MLGPLLARLRRLALAISVLALAPLLTGALASDQEAIARVEDYLNGIRTLRATFLQIADDGSIARGRLYIERPGRLRIEYDPPVKVVLVADAGWLTFIDYGLGQISQTPLGDTPAEILVRERVSLSGEIAVARVERLAGTLRLTLVQAEEPEAGSLTLVFSEEPFELRQWVVVDPQGATTRVSLAEVERDVALDPALFEAPPPTPDSSLGR